jgi:hypothetical protein
MFNKGLKYWLRLDKVRLSKDSLIVIVPLAFLMAKSHGLTEFEKTLEESIRSMDGVDPDKIIEQAEVYSRKGKALLPLRPLYMGNENYCIILD